MKKDSSKLTQLFFSMLYISAFTFGGGFVIATFMKKKFVDEFHWIDENEMLDLIAIAQSSPGAIAVNTAILVGWRVAGFTGVLISVLGTILPPMLILIVISFFYAEFAANRVMSLVLKGMQAGVAAILLDVVLDLAEKVVKQKSIVKDGMMFLAFAAVFFLKVNVIYIILSALAAGIVLAFAERRKEA